jgi:hypothetical protein
MHKKVESKSGKKPYSKPQVTRVKLAITEATLGTCWTDDMGFADTSTCHTIGVCPT